MDSHDLQVAGFVFAPGGPAPTGQRRGRLSPAACLLAVGVCLVSLGCASGTGIFPAWMSGDAKKSPGGQFGGNSSQPPAAQVSQAPSPFPDAGKTQGSKKETTPAQALQEYARDLASARDMEKSGDLADARSLYEHLIATQPGRYEAYHRLAVVADRQRRYDEAQSLYSQAIRLNHGNPELFNDLGYCYYLQGDLDKAESALAKAVSMRPSEPRYRNNLGLVYGQQRHYDKALEQYRRAGGEGNAYYNLAFIKASQNDYEGAKVCFRRALAADPTHERARKALASFENAENQPKDLARMSALADEETEWIPYVEKDAASTDAVKTVAAESPASAGHAGATQQRSATQGLIEAAQTRAAASDRTMSR